jgi:hypothetical protein
MKASRGMGDINPSKMPKGKKIVRKDKPQDVEMYKKGGKVKMPSTPKAPKGKKYAEGGEAKSKVNEAGNYTKPSKREALFKSIKASATHGTAAGQWSARKAQLLAKRYKESGGGYK